MYSLMKAPEESGAFFCVRAVVSAGRRDYIGIKERQGRQKI
jgi:hypothetical protein